jgi:hypothetical protein
MTRPSSKNTPSLGTQGPDGFALSRREVLTAIGGAAFVPSSVVARPLDLDNVPVAVPYVADVAVEDAKIHYLEAVQRILSAQTRLLDLIEDEFHRSGVDDLTSTEALLLYRIGKQIAPIYSTRTLHWADAQTHDRLIKARYLRIVSRRRPFTLALTRKGRSVADKLEDSMVRKLSLLRFYGVEGEKLAVMNDTLARLDHTWSDSVRYSL